MNEFLIVPDLNCWMEVPRMKCKRMTRKKLESKQEKTHLKNLQKNNKTVVDGRRAWMVKKFSDD